MVNLINSNVMFGLMSAASHAGMSQFCTGMYNAAKGRGDEAAMERAMGYASQYRDKAMDAKEQTGEALIESAKEARLQEKLEQDQRLEEKRAEQQLEAEALQETSDATTRVVESAPQPAYILDLSQEYLESTKAGTATVPDNAAIVTPAAKYISAIGSSGSAGVVYSPSNPTDFSHVKIAVASPSSGTGTTIDLKV